MAGQMGIYMEILKELHCDGDLVKMVELRKTPPMGCQIVEMIEALMLVYQVGRLLEHWQWERM